MLSDRQRRFRAILWGATLLVAVLGSGCQNRSPVTVSPAGRPKPPQPKIDESSPQLQFIQTEPLELEQQIRRGDRILFVGDELTQQMHFTRAVAAALIAMMPEADLRFFNGGKDGATVQSAASWIDDLLDLVDPTVVFVCLGPPAPHLLSGAEDFEKDLSRLIERIRRSDPTPRVVLLSRPAVASNAGSGANAIHYQLALATQQVASQQNVGFIDLFVPMNRVHHGAASATGRGSVLTYGGRLLTEEAHIVLASICLYGIGVQPADLDPVGWSPLVPLKMRRIRQALGLTLHTVPLEQAIRSRQLYESISTFDEHFFRGWRLATTAEDRAPTMAGAEAAWENVRQIAQQYSANSTLAGHKATP